MMIGSKQRLSRCNHLKDTGVSIRINADDITWVGSTKYLGVQIDENLAWDDQINSIKFKVSRSVGLLMYVKKFLSNDMLCKMYRGLVETYFSCCSSVFGCCTYLFIYLFIYRETMNIQGVE